MICIQICVCVFLIEHLTHVLAGLWPLSFTWTNPFQYSAFWVLSGSISQVYQTIFHGQWWYFSLFLLLSGRTKKNMLSRKCPVMAKLSTAKYCNKLLWNVRSSRADILLQTTCISMSNVSPLYWRMVSLWPSKRCEKQWLNKPPTQPPHCNLKRIPSFLKVEGSLFSCIFKEGLVIFSDFLTQVCRIVQLAWNYPVMNEKANLAGLKQIWNKYRKMMRLHYKTF